MIADLGFLSETAMDFLRISEPDSLYNHIVDRLLHIVGGAWVGISTYHSERDTTCLRAMKGSGGIERVVFKLLGGNIIGRHRRLSEEAKQALLTGRLHRVPGGIHKVSFGTIPKTISAALEKAGDVGDIHSMGCVAEGELFGSVVMMLRREEKLQKPELVEAFIGQAAVALRHSLVRAGLRASVEKYNVLMDHVQDVVIVMDTDLNIKEINQAACELLGCGSNDLIGRKATSILDPSSVRSNPIRWELFSDGKPFAAERPIVRADGSKVKVRAEFRFLLNDEIILVARQTEPSGLAVS